MYSHAIWELNHPHDRLSVILDHVPLMREHNLGIPLSITQSIFYSANIPGAARLSGAAAESVFNRKIDLAVP